MYRILVCLLMVLATTGRAAIVGNADVNPTSEDSLAIPILSLDSLGNPAAADSIFLSVTAPDGSPAFADSFPVSDSRIVVRTTCSRPQYVLRAAVDDLDSSGAAGVYAVSVVARNTTTGLLTPTVATFQIVGLHLSERLSLLDDTVVVNGGVIDSNRTERGLSQGGGQHTVSLLARDTVSGEVVPYSRITVRNIEQSALLGLGVTDVSGTAMFLLDSDSIVVLASSVGYTFDPETLVVNAPLFDTLPAAPVTVDPPPSPDLCRVWGYLFGIDASPLDGVTVRAALPDGVVRYGGVIVSPHAVETVTDSTGRFQLDLLPSASLSPSDTKYEITITRTDGTVLRQRVLVPDQAVWELAP